MRNNNKINLKSPNVPTPLSPINFFINLIDITISPLNIANKSTIKRYRFWIYTAVYIYSYRFQFLIKGFKQFINTCYSNGTILRVI